MGLNTGILKYIIKVKKQYNLKGPILTFGNQDIYASEHDIVRWLKKEELPVRMPDKIQRSTSQSLLRVSPKTANFIHAKTFFEFLGIPKEEYYDIDKFDFDKPKILQDLEKPLDTKYHNFFNFVLDSGTIEHIFDVKTVMENIVNAVKVGGYALQVVPAENFLNHGFYQFSPTFFYDFYAANQFEIIEAYIIELRNFVYRFYSYDHMKDFTGLIFFNPKYRRVNCFLVRKLGKVRDITSPVQYLLQQSLCNHDKLEEEFKKTLFDKIVTVIRKYVPVAFHGYFYSLWVRMKTITSHRPYFDIYK